MKTIFYKKYLILILLILIIGILVFIKRNNLILNFENNNKKQEITIKVINLKSNLEKKKGLMFVKKMDFDTGALFNYNNSGIYCVWMKNTYIPLELIYLDEKFEIVELIKNMKPFDLENKCNKKHARYFIEVNKGFINSKKLKIGDKININIIEKII